jgi:hypothetical protein
MSPVRRPHVPPLAPPRARGLASTLATVAAGLVAALVQTLACAAPASAPAGFEIAPRHATTRAAWSTLAGESPNALDRSLIERTCAMRRSIGATQSAPVFESGTDQPDVVQVTRIASATAIASYETVRGTACDPATMTASGDLCGCTFRRLTSRFVHIRRAIGEDTELIDVDLVKGTGTQRTRSGPLRAGLDLPDPAAFGPVVGHDVVAGMPCALRRQELGSGRTERCLADAADGVPPALRLQELARTVYLLGPAGPSRRDWRRTERLDPEAEVDLGVFDPPAGIAWRTLDSLAARRR